MDGITTNNNKTTTTTTTTLLSSSSQQQQRRQLRSAWEEGLDMIESLLQVGTPTEAVMSAEQKIGLRKLKKILLLSGVESIESHIPNSLLKDEYDDTDNDDDGGDDNNNSRRTNDDSRRYLLTNFGGYNPPEEDAKGRVQQIVAAHKVARKIRTRAIAASSTNRAPVMVPPYEGGPPLPARWKTLDRTAQHTLRDSLRWEQLCRWDFDVFTIEKILGKEGGTLLFVAWAILASPQAQYSMDYACDRSDRDGKTDDDVVVVPPMTDRLGYQFCEHFGIREDMLVEFLDTIESLYVRDTPYHNSVHAADVLQTLHAMLQGGGIAYATTTCSTAGGDDDDRQNQDLELFGLLLAAVIHDVGHKGLNNLFQVHSRSDLALLYNDISVLENMHLATAFQLIMGEDRDGGKVDIFESLNDDQISVVRNMMVKSVLATDMTQHFAKNDYIKGILMTRADDDEENNSNNNVNGNDTNDQPPQLPHIKLATDPTTRRHILGYFLHLADISNPAKRIDIGTQWTDRVLEEFFLQGDREDELGLPISPLCCRKTTSRAQSQIGFINYVVLPSYEILGQLIPAMETDVLPIIKENLKFWHDQKNLESHQQ